MHREEDECDTEEGEGGEGEVHEVKGGVELEEIGTAEDGEEGGGDPAGVFGDARENPESGEEEEGALKEPGVGDLMGGGDSSPEKRGKEHHKRRAHGGLCVDVEAGVQAFKEVGVVEGFGEVVGFGDVVGLIPVGFGGVRVDHGGGGEEIEESDDPGADPGAGAGGGRAGGMGWVGVGHGLAHEAAARLWGDSAW